MISPAELKAIFRQHNFRPKKRLGQNFLIDGNVARNIVGACNITKDDVVVEIGAGFGQLTEELASRAKFVYAVERDIAAFDILKDRLAGRENLKVIHGDIMELQLQSILGAQRAKVIGNLPYYITSPTITRLIEQRQNVREIFITVQKEFAERLMALPGEKAYGSITCHVRYFAKPAMLFGISRRSFYPQPEVDSAFSRLEILPHPPVSAKSEDLFFKIVRASFGQRRKTILNSLAGKTDKIKVLEILKKAGISPDRRGETLSLEEFAQLANAWYNQDYGSHR